MIISGNIKDNTGEPLMGANIYATLSSGGKIGGISDFDGNFNIDLGDKELSSPVTISYLGFQNKTFEPSQLNNANVVLSEGEEMLDEVVVIAKKKPKSKKGIEKNNLIGIASLGAGLLALGVILIKIKK